MNTENYALLETVSGPAVIFGSIARPSAAPGDPAADVTDPARARREGGGGGARLGRRGIVGEICLSTLSTSSSTVGLGAARGLAPGLARGLAGLATASLGVLGDFGEITVEGSAALPSSGDA